MTVSLRVVIVISGLGHVVHNLEEFGFTLLALGQTLFPVAVTALLFWWAARPSRAYLITLGVWGLIVLVAGGGSVFPAPFLPFEPAQTVSHYLAHAVYAALQVPLLVVVWRALRRQPDASPAPAS